MIRRELADTIASVLRSLQPPPGCGLRVTEADVELPLEVFSGLRDGKLVFYGAPPHSRWESGILPQVHRARFRAELVAPSAPSERPK